MAKKKYLEESERKLIESVNNAYIPTDWDEFEKRYHEMERYGDGKPRKVDKEKMEYIEDGLVSRGIEGNQLSSLLSTIVEESGGNPFSVDDSGKFRGLIQFSKERYPEKDFDRDKKVGWKKAIDNQLDAIVDHLNEYGGDYGFLDGGDGSGYMTGEEAKDAFWGRDSDIENVTRALTYGFVRPGDRSGTTENRTRVARLINEIIQPPVETPDVLEFDYDGKHYRAETPEDVTPEMRRALMLSKLVGEKNKVELQDPLYTTFDEAYGRAKSKGASVFMWNGKKYSTKEDGGEVKDMEKFGKILESLYNEDVERVRNGEQAQYFGVLNDKPLENVYPEFDLISKPANMVSKGADMINRPLGVISGDIKEDVYGGLEKMAKYTGKVDDYVRKLYYKGTKSVFDKLPEIVKPLARQVFSKYYNWRRLTVPETIRLSREIFGGEDEPESFDAAFKAARDQGLDKFEWNGNEYTTDIKEEGGLSRLAPRNNTSVGRPGSAEVSPVTPSDAARNNPVISTIASFTPIVGEMLDIQDLYTSLKNNDKTGILLALTGLVPIIGGVAGNVIKRNNPFWKERIFSPEEIKRDEELVSKFPNYARPNSPMGAAVLNHEERLVNNAFRKFQNIPASRIGIDPETGNVVYDFNGLDFRFVDISNADELKKISDYTGLTSEGLLEYIGNNPFTSFGDHILINRKYIDEAAEKGETDFIFRDGIPHNSPQEEVVRSHEIDHLVGHGVQRESAENSGFSFDWMDDYPELGKEYSGYFRFNDNTEVAARGSQLKDYFGLTNSEQKITPEMLEYAYRHYLDDYGINNDMDLFFKSITDFKKASDWINKYSTAGLGAYWLFDRAESVKDENLQNGGLIKFSKKIDGSSIFERNMVSPWRKITRDMVPTASPSWTNKRKRRFGRKDGGDVSNITPRDNTSVGRPGSADVSIRENIVDSSMDSLMSGVFDEHRWVVKRIGNEEFYTNSPLLKTLPSMSREDVALSLLPPELWPGILKRKEDVTGKSARRHFIRGGEVSELQDYIYDRLTKEHGIAPIQAIGIVANLTQESALDYDALGDNGRSYGIQQWQGDRRKNLFEFAKKRGRDKPALDDQVDFLVEEYKGDGFLFPTRGENMYKTGKTDKDMFDYFQYSKLDFDNAANIYDSTRAWAQGFGRGNKNFLNMDRRFHIAKTLSSRYNIDAGGQSFYTDMGYKDEWGSPVPEVAVSAEKKAAQDDWMEKYGNKMLASILAGDGEGGDTHVTNNYYVNEEGLSEDEKRNAAEVRELQQKQQTQELLASIIDGIKLDIKGVTEVRKR